MWVLHNRDSCGVRHMVGPIGWKITVVQSFIARTSRDFSIISSRVGSTHVREDKYTEIDFFFFFFEKPKLIIIIFFFFIDNFKK